MEPTSDSIIQIVVIDDDLLIRYPITVLLDTTFGLSKSQVDIVNSHNGVEGLGLIFSINPDIIILDTTLPKYSGREIVDYITTNSKFEKSKIILLHDESKPLNSLNENITVLSKKDSKFVDTLIEEVIEAVPEEKKITVDLASRGVRYNTIKFLTKILVKIGNSSDQLIRKITEFSIVNLVRYFLWFLHELFASIPLMFLVILAPSVKDSDIRKNNTDSKLFRVQEHPSLSIYLVKILFFILQFLVFIIGGIIIIKALGLIK